MIFFLPEIDDWLNSCPVRIDGAKAFLKLDSPINSDPLIMIYCRIKSLK